MRPVGEISSAILKSAARLVREVDGVQRGPSLQELARDACVGVQAARRTVSNLCRARKLQPIAERRVPYRNRPILEYAPAAEQAEAAAAPIAAVMAAWAAR